MKPSSFPGFALHDTPLRDDVRRLGAWAGRMLAEQVSPAFLDQVERIRTAAIARRRQKGAPLALLSDLLDELPAAHAQWSIRINDQWRVCFVWTGGHAADVEIVDYH
jgi:phosphoenolpyruvate carboxylase